MEEIHNPFDFKTWWNAIQAIPNNEQGYPERAILYQKALSYIPGSYKLWFNFLKESTHFVSQFELSNYQEAVLELFESSLQTMFNMPRIWLDFAQFCAKC